MSRAVTIFSAALLLAPQTVSAQTPTIEEFTVSGIPVIHKFVEANDVIAAQLYLKGGSAALTPETSGIERFIIEVAPRGTEKYDKDAFAARTAATGTAIGGQNFHDYTVLSVQAVRDYWDESWDLFTQAALHPTFPEAEVDLVREQIINALKGRLDNPDAALALLANEVMYEGHPYAIDPAGTVEAVSALTAADLETWHARRMTRDNLLIVVVGNVTRDELETKIERAFASLPESGDSPPVIDPPEIEGAEIRVETRDLPTNYIRAQFSTPSPGHPDYAPLRVAADILSDRLFEEIRTKRNLSYAVFSGVSQRRANYGLLYVTAVEPDTTVRVMLSEVERLKSELISAERLQESINVFTTQYWLGQETNMGQATALGTFELVGGGWEGAERFVERVNEVTPVDIQRVSDTYFTNLRFAVIGDPAKITGPAFPAM